MESESRLMVRFIETSVNLPYSPPSDASWLSNTSSTDACPTGLRALEPLKMTSVKASPRRYLGEFSPITQDTASMIFDLPQPFGPTTATRLLGSMMLVGSTNDLKPASLIFESCISLYPYLIASYYAMFFA